jgi:branched-chain amino acid transport system permease protein
MAPDPLMYSFRTTVPHAYIALLALLLVTAVFVWIDRGAMGYRLRAIKGNEAAAEVIGVNTMRVKLSAAVISGALMGALGTLYVQLALFFDPDTAFGLVPISVRVALIAIIGGVGTALGPLIGAAFIIPLEEFANDLLSSGAAGLSQIAYALVLIAVILWRPRGLVTLFDAVSSKVRKKP